MGIIEINIDGEKIHPHELEVVTEVRPEFLLPVTLTACEGKSALMYSAEGLVPLMRFTKGAGNGNGSSVPDLFALLSGYIRALLKARDMLLDTALVSSDPENGVFVESGAQSLSVIKTVWGADDCPDNNEKICRLADALSAHERIMGAKTLMERMTSVIRSQNPSLLTSLKLAESLCREWNHINLAA